MDPKPLPIAPHPAQSEPFFIEQIEKMRVHLQTLHDMPGLDTFRETAELPEAFFSHLNDAMACFDRVIEYILGYDGTDKRIKCSKGCCNCCIDLVRGLSTPEVINIYNHVRLWPDAKQIFEYHRESAEKFMEILLRKLKPGEVPGITGADDRVDEAHTEFNQLNRPCGFLDQESGLCRIYPVRPIACRFFFSIDPPEMCNPDHPKYLNRDTCTVHLPDEIHILLRQIGKKFGFITLNYLSGAFCAFASDIMKIRPIKTVPDDDWTARHGGGGSEDQQRDAGEDA